MKVHITKIFTIMLLSTMVLFTSCNWIDTDINVDPDSPSEVPLSMLLPSIQANMAYELGGNDVVLPTNVWMQHLNGYARQMQTTANYQFRPADPNNFWDNCYNSVMMDCKVMIDKAMATEAYHFAGIAQISQAQTLMVVTDLFGDVPFSEAFQGSENLMPKVDTQQEIYTSIYNLLTDAIANLSNADNKIAIAGDMIHGGSAAAWIKTAYALQARAALALSERGAAQAYAAVLTVLPKAYTSNADNYAFWFGTSPTELSPITQFDDQRGDVTMGKFFMDMLIANADPRMPFFAKKSDAGDYAGGSPGSAFYEGISFAGPYISSKSAPVATNFMTFAECKFIEAEAKLASGDAPGATAAYIAAVEASCERVIGSLDDIGDWLDANIRNESALTLEKIITQKYIANFGQMQPYNDWRRTDFPKGLLKPASATIELPRRYPYPQDEITYNSNIEALWQNTVFLQTPVWWDAK